MKIVKPLRFAGKHFVLVLIVIVCMSAVLWFAFDSSYEPERVIEGGGSGYTSTVCPMIAPVLRTLMRRLPEKSIGYQKSQEVLANIPAYERLIASTFSNTRGLKLDFILMIHKDISDDSWLNALIPECQVNIKKILTQLRADVIGFEGASLDLITFDGLTRSMYDSNRKLGADISMDQARTAVQNWESKDGVLMYLRSNPNALVIGTEDDALLVLQLLLVKSFERELASESPSDALRLYGFLTQLRSEIALAKVVAKLQALNKNHGVVVIGSSHGADYIPIVTGLSSRAEFYQATPQRYFEKYPEARLPLADDK